MAAQTTPKKRPRRRATISQTGHKDITLDGRIARAYDTSASGPSTGQRPNRVKPNALERKK